MAIHSSLSGVDEQLFQVVVFCTVGSQTIITIRGRSDVIGSHVLDEGGHLCDFLLDDFHLGTDGFRMLFAGSRSSETPDA